MAGALAAHVDENGIPRLSRVADFAQFCGLVVSPGDGNLRKKPMRPLFAGLVPEFSPGGIG
jgi:hypothetical protein